MSHMRFNILHLIPRLIIFFWPALPGNPSVLQIDRGTKEIHESASRLLAWHEAGLVQAENEQTPASSRPIEDVVKKRIEIIREQTGLSKDQEPKAYRITELYVRDRRKIIDGNADLTVEQVKALTRAFDEYKMAIKSILTRRQQEKWEAALAAKSAGEKQTGNSHAQTVPVATVRDALLNFGD
jgi:hypothetical protein